MKKFKELFHSLFKEDKPKQPQHVFNCRDLIWISPIDSYLYAPNTYNHYFYLYWDKGLVIKACQKNTEGDSCPDLSKLRELFINNIGYSYVSIDEDTDNIQYYVIQKEDI